MGFDFGGIGDFLGSAVDWVDKNYKPILRAAGIGAAAYGTHRQNEARKKQNQAYNDAMEQDYQDRLAAYNARGSGGGGSGGGGQGRASKLYQEYYNRSLEMLKPYVDAGHRLLPHQEELYKKGMGGLTELGKIMLTPQSFALTNQSVPAYNIPLELPESLKGGAKKK